MRNHDCERLTESLNELVSSFKHVGMRDAAEDITAVLDVVRQLKDDYAVLAKDRAHLEGIAKLAAARNVPNPPPAIDWKKRHDELERQYYSLGAQLRTTKDLLAEATKQINEFDGAARSRVIYSSELKRLDQETRDLAQQLGNMREEYNRMHMELIKRRRKNVRASAMIGDLKRQLEGRPASPEPLVSQVVNEGTFFLIRQISSQMMPESVRISLLEAWNTWRQGKS